jgi:hypothetical protein
MKIDHDIPFYANTPDNTHCFQATLKMVIKHFWPMREYSWEELDRITAKAEGLWTWPLAGLLWLANQGLEVKNIEVFDYSRFIEHGGDYLIAEFGEEFGKAQIEHSDIDQERALAATLLERGMVMKAIPTLHLLKQLLGEGYVVICNINSRRLKNEEGYAGHFVVVKGFDEQHLFLHNPGLPPLANQAVPFELFEQAWAYPNEKAKNIMAFKSQL